MFGLERLVSSLALGKIALLERRVEQLELAQAEDRMALLETIDNVTYRLAARERKRKAAAGASENDSTVVEEPGVTRFLGAARRFGKS